MNIPQRQRSLWLVLVAISLVCAISLYRLLIPGYGSPILDLASAATARAESQAAVAEPLVEGALSGGRARGGTFSRPSAPSYSSPGRIAPRPYSSDYGEYPRPYPRSTYPRSSYPRSAYPVPFPAPVIVPPPVFLPAPAYPVPASEIGGGGSEGFEFIVLLLIVGFLVLPLVLNFLRSSSGASPYARMSERDNDILTITQVQIGLLSQARELQRSLTELTQRANLSTQTGLTEALRESVLALMRSPQYWSHARVRSQTLNSREAAAARFEQLSIEERSKFRTETLVNIGGTVQRQTRSHSRSSDPGAYILVTLLIATTHDRPMVNQVHSVDELQQTLQRLGAIAPEDLLVYELIWTPQDERDTLSYDEMIAQYPSLVQL